MSKCVCASCFVEADCAWNDWSLYDPDNKKCPNYKAGMKQFKEFLIQYEKDKNSI